MRLRRDRLMIVLRPSSTRHKFRLCTGFATGRPPEHPPGRPPTVSHTGDGEKADKDYKKYKAPDGAFHEPRVTRGDVVILNLLPRSGI